MIDREGRNSVAKYVIGIGASAGGLDALERFFKSAPLLEQVAYVVVQHLSPNYRSLMPELLARRTLLSVKHAEDGEVISERCVYLIPPGQLLSVMQGTLRLVPQPPRATFNAVEPAERSGGNNSRRSIGADKLPTAERPLLLETQLSADRLPIDTFFDSLAMAFSERALAIVLSGTGTDGMRGAKTIKGQGGSVFVQTPESAQFDGMPRSTISTGFADLIALPEALADAVVHHFGGADSALASAAAVNHQNVEHDAMRTSLLKHLQARVGVDFLGYRPSTLDRRIARRIRAVGAKNLPAYCRYVEAQPKELDALKRDLQIGVTRFFRDPDAFFALGKHAATLVAEIAKLADDSPHKQIRIWVPACATGEEAYSIAMLFLEQLRDHAITLKIFATDIDTTALQRASEGSYSKRDVEDIPADLLAKYFSLEGARYSVRPTLRQCIVFAQHDVLSDPPFTRMDLISCRNLLIYLQAPTQRKLLARFQFALKDQALLMLGLSQRSVRF
jgi:two-component system, chemotaxis family, CheB/CheR fusion protein